MNKSTATPIVEYWCVGASCCDAVWEAAYQRFETPDQERRKFSQRLRWAGFHQFPKTWHIAELFCGRGQSLQVLESWGYSHLYGVDLSPQLLQQYRGSARLFVGDCQQLGWPDNYLDAVIIQGGLHHLPDLNQSLPAVCAELTRVLKPGGLFFLVEPWLTPFLHLVHTCCRSATLRQLWPRLDALQTMIQREEKTYSAWLTHPTLIITILRQHFTPLKLTQSWGKLKLLAFNPKTSPSRLSSPSSP
ncbi:MAG: hypothetical protein KatS3mg113_0947 [Planctomycetaceae bacterium]|nr:MAG: hypothetical protein KatS3mg113_0947 [Planctomycetaceae bacterium]